MALEVGSVVQGKYRITRLIGRGGMGSVYEGENTLIARRVAIKVLHGELQAHPQAIERFEREAQAAGKIGNDHIIEVLDLGELPDGDHFMVMEYLDGESLEDRLDRVTMLTAREAVPLVRQLLVGLGAAHDKGIIHRDLKPENVFILREKAGQPDFVKLIDFGISKFTATADLRMTATGAVMGTPFYMSPEQAKGSREIDVRTDLYAVGVILYRCITGEVPFPGENFNEVLFKVVLSQPRNPREFAPALEPGFETLIERAMARDPSQRFQTAREFIAALDAWSREGRVVSLPPPQQTSVAAVSQPVSGPLGPPSVPGVPSPSSTVAVPMQSQGVLGSPNSTSAEWTQSGLTSSRSSSAKFWILAVALLGAGALAGGVLYFGDAGPTLASSGEALSPEQPKDSQPLRPDDPLKPSRIEGSEPVDRLSSGGQPQVLPSASATATAVASADEEDEEHNDDESDSSDENTGKHRKKRSGARTPKGPPAGGAAETPPPPPPPPRPPSKKEPDFGY